MKRHMPLVASWQQGRFRSTHGGELNRRSQLGPQRSPESCWMSPCCAGDRRTGTAAGERKSDVGLRPDRGGSGESGPPNIGHHVGRGWSRDFFFIRPLPRVNSPTDSAENPIFSAINPPGAIQKILACLGLPTRAPPIAPAIPDRDEAALW